MKDKYLNILIGLVIIAILSTFALGNEQIYQGAMQLLGDTGSIIDPATETKQDDAITGLSAIETNQTDATQKTQIVTSAGVAYSSDPALTACVGEQVALSRITYINKFGFNEDVDASTLNEDIWDGGALWVPPTVARTHNFTSTDADDSGTVQSTGTATGGSTTTLVDTGADFSGDGVVAGDTVLNDTTLDHSIVVVGGVTATTLTLEVTHHAAFTGTQGFNSGDTYRVVTPASTGASVVHMYGLDSSMDEQEEFIVLDGAGAVATARTYWRIYRMHLDGAADRTVNNEGIIKATAITDATVTAQINVGNGQTLGTPYTIPNDTIGCLTQFSATIYKSAVGALAQMALRQTKFAGPDGAGSIIEHYFSLATDGSSHIHHTFKPYKRFEQKTDIWMRAETASSDNAAISGAFDIILVAMN